MIEKFSKRLLLFFSLPVLGIPIQASAFLLNKPADTLTKHPVTWFYARETNTPVAAVQTTHSRLTTNAAPVGVVPVVNYQTPKTYSINVGITPLAPANTGGPVPANIYGEVSTLAGGRAPVTYDSFGTDAGFNLPSGVGTATDGTIYVSDYGSGAIRKVTPAGAVTTINNISAPASLTLDNQNNIYISDFQSNNIFKISAAGVKTVFAGNNAAGYLDGTGSGASFNSPGGVTTDALGNIYVADQQNNRIRKITPGGLVITVAGNGSAGAVNDIGLAASFNNPDGVAVDKQGNIFVADTKNNLIREITPTGAVTTFAGSGAAGYADGTGTAAAFNYPTSLAFDASGNLFVADYKNDLIRKISPAGLVTTIAGTGSGGAVNGVGVSASFNYPIGLAFDGNGNLFVTDFANYLLRKITLTGYTIDKPLPAGLTFDMRTGIISGTPTVVSPATDYTVTAYNSSGSSTTVVNIRVTANPLKPSVITFNSLPPAQQNIIQPTATSTNPETPIIYTSSNPAVAIITADGKIRLVGVGYAVITATQAGNDNYSDAVPVSRQLTVYQQGFIRFNPLPVKYVIDADFDPGATSNVTAYPVTYTSSNPAVATIVNGQIHITGIGTTTITASQAGDALNLQAQPVSQVLTVKAALSFGPISPKITCDVDFDPGAVSPQAITYFSNHTNVATIVNGKVHIVGPGITTITATSPGQSLQQNLIVSAVPQPAIYITAAIPSPDCSGSAVVFTAQPTNPGINPTYVWKVNDVATGPNDVTFATSTLVNGDQVTCTLINNNTCPTPLTATSSPIIVSVVSPQSPAPTVSISVSVNGVYSGTPITFTAVTQNAASLLSYQWMVNGVNSGENEDTFTSSTFKNNDIVTCTITVAGACTPPATSNAAVVTIIPPPTITVTNAFTPNGDGVNDTWVINDLSFYPNCLVRVFDRYGGMVLQSAGYQKPWDGTYGGTALPAGVYYYIIDLKNGTKKLAGNLTILK
ncbi:gliding motility-associated C-terminal domain-containing protein [Mucilaginibacter dorajii]|uniref:Ig-like domain-containing protein n=1 Tax=Mucilaginibacter dorajii TaxID=692994 RepID=A0ABP7QFG1_9SPHI|nr:gliding motility-associated C-terminal domain-containing protein [Mucilaginibacter dorajii]MCS3736041.1 gliding motility-associated-like protein [Mucilaginibacter dorajii]